MKIPACLLATLLLAACAPVQSHKAPAVDDPAMQKLLPAKFEYYGGSSWAYRSIRWEDGRIVYQFTNPGSPRVHTRYLHPTAAQWHEFWKVMDAVDIWDWRPRYVTPGEVVVMDGLNWDFSISHGGRSVTSAGKSAFPADADPRKAGRSVEESTRRFNRFSNAVMKLAGEKPDS